MKTIYLASKSPRRKELLRQAGIPFELLPLRVHPVERRDVDETPLAAEPAADYVVRIARLKAEAAIRIMTTRHLTHRLVLAAAGRAGAGALSAVGRVRRWLDAGGRRGGR